jgi:hypothetical protein
MSDSWITAGIRKSHAAQTTGQETKPPLLKTIAGRIIMSKASDWKKRRNEEQIREIAHIEIPRSFPALIAWNGTPSE